MIVTGAPGSEMTIKLPTRSKQAAPYSKGKNPDGTPANKNKILAYEKTIASIGGDEITVQVTIYCRP